MPTSPFNIWEGKHFRESLPLDLGSYYATRKGSYIVHSERLGTGSYSSLELLLLWCLITQKMLHIMISDQYPNFTDHWQFILGISMSLDTRVILLSRQHNERLLYFDLLVLWSLTMHAHTLHLTLSLPSIITHKIWIKCHTGNLYSFDPSILLFIIKKFALICSSETFALITVIDKLEGRTGRIVHFLLHFIRHLNNHSRCGLV